MTMFLLTMYFILDFTKVIYADAFNSWHSEYTIDNKPTPTTPSLETTNPRHSITFSSLVSTMFRFPRFICGTSWDPQSSEYENTSLAHVKDDSFTPYSSPYNLPRSVTFVLFGSTPLLAGGATVLISLPSNFIENLLDFGFESLMFAFVFAMSAFMLADMFLDVYVTSIATRVMRSGE